MIVTTAICGTVGALGHVVLGIGAANGWDDDTIFWQPVVGFALTTVAVTAFGGFYLASERARIAIAASFLLTFLVALTYIVTIEKLADDTTRGAAAEVFTDFRTVVITIVGFYFGSEAIISVAKVWRGTSGEGDDAADADRDLAPAPVK